jgi:hypothetical protein
MKRIFTILAAITIGSTGFGQVFQSDLSSWDVATGLPTDWTGTKTNLISGGGTITEVQAGASYGSSLAQLVNDNSSAKRLASEPTTVTAGETYEIKMWVSALAGDVSTRVYDLTNIAWGTFNPAYINIAGTTNSMISQTVTIPAGCTSVEFLLYIKNTGATGMALDSVSVAITTPAPPAALVSIYDIQYTTDVSGDSPELGNILTTRGVVTGVYQIGSNAERFFIQHGDGAWNGIYVYENGTSVTLGDSVKVTGTVLEYNGLTEMGYVSNITVLNSGNAQPTAVVVTSATVGNEEYEGVLVKVEDGINTVAPNQYGAWTINEGGDITIDDDLMAPFTPVLNNAYDVTGVRHLSFGEILVLPRTASTDIIVTGNASINETVINANIFPNPANNNVTISGVNGMVSIYAINGEVVYNGTITNTLNINTQNLTTGLYVVEVIENNAKANYKLIVE